ncbi:hypothetical protein ACOMHN_041294 [Nucella lapillus]
MTVSCFNAQSISRKRNKRVEIENVIRDESIDIMFITETWLKPQGDEAACVDLTPGGYSMRSFPRQARRGGGIAFITRNSLFEHATVTTEFPFDHNSFELVQLTLDGHHRVSFFCLYRPPPSKVNKLTDGMFFEEFSELLEHANVMGGKTVFLGDFNISWDRPAHPNTIKAVDLLDMFSLSQAVNFPTHRDGHTIDWCVFREEELILRSGSRGPSLTSDHMPVMCYLDIAKPSSTPVFQTVRNLRAIDKSQFCADVAAVFHNQPPATVEQLEAHLRAVLDVHAPAIRRLQTQRRSSPCFVDFLNGIQSHHSFQRLPSEEKLLFGELVVAAENNELYEFVNKLGLSHHSFQRLPSEEKLLFGELVVAAENNELDEFVDRVGLVRVLKLMDHMSSYDAEKFAAYLAEVSIFVRGARGGGGGASGHEDVINKRGHDHHSSLFSYISDLHSSYFEHLPAPEKTKFNGLLQAANDKQMTQYLTTIGYGPVFGLLEHLNADHAYEVHRLIENALAAESAVPAPVKRQLGGHHGNFYNYLQSLNSEYYETLPAPERQIYHDLMDAVKNHNLTAYIDANGYGPIFGFLERSGGREAGCQQQLKMLNKEETTERYTS